MTDFSMSDEELARWLEQRRKAAADGGPTKQQLSVQLLKHTLKAIALGVFTEPFVWDEANDRLLIRTEHMARLQSVNTAREWRGRISGRGLKRELILLEVVEMGADGEPVRYEKTVNRRRVSHMVAIKLSAATALVLPEAVHEAR